MFSKELLSSYKSDDLHRVTDAVSRMVLARPPWEGRAIRAVHPSDVYPKDWCARATWFRITTGEVRNPTFLTREIIFAEGHEYHRKWQHWLWDLGRLIGMFACAACGNEWWDTSPSECSWCHIDRRGLEYREVPVRDDDINLVGHADGMLVEPDDEPSLLEIKSIGEGTVRLYHPALLAKNTHVVDGRKIIDMHKVWRDLRSPFRDHIKQVNIYGALKGVTTARIVYEFKATGAFKEFKITLDPDIAAPLLQRAKDINDAAARGEEPACTSGDKACARCRPYDEETTDGEGEAEDDQRPADGAAGVDGRTGAGPAPAADGGDADPAGGRDRPTGPGVDGAVPGVAGLARLSERTARRRRRAGG